MTSSGFPLLPSDPKVSREFRKFIQVSSPKGMKFLWKDPDDVLKLSNAIAYFEFSRQLDALIYWLRDGSGNLRFHGTMETRTGEPLPMLLRLREAELAHLLNNTSQDNPQ